MTTLLQSAPESAPAAVTTWPIKLRLSAMMFLQYFMQGAYLPIVSVYVQDYLGFDSREVGWFGSALAVGPLFAPVVVGQLVDRHFATQRVLAVCHLLAGIVMLVLYAQTQFWPVILLGTVYSVLYIPTMMLTNSLALSHLANREREFPRIRMWGTIGFIVPAWLIEYCWLSGLEADELAVARGVAFALAGVAGLVMAAYCLSLPDTPPAGRPNARFAPAEIAGLLADRRLLVLVLISFLIAVVHNFYFVWNSPFLTSVLARSGIRGAWEQRISSLGQVSEIAVMAVLGLALARWGFKRVMLIGTLGYLLRCLLLAAAGSEVTAGASLALATVAQAMHGLCFGCFLAAAFIYVDRIAPADARGSMQTLYGNFVVGLGAVAGAWLAGQVGYACEMPGAGAPQHAWVPLWLSSAAVAGICAIGFAALFPDDRQPESSPVHV
ncbi:MAG TPA: MFS transporter [Pirellulales bacterium]|jgi:nucleoside transporter|nr:MFS transporter [Pirellulales bacterium]